jgi:hypothetical protein
MANIGGRETPELRARILGCDCGLEGCTSVYVVVQQRGAHEDLWLAMGVAPEGLEKAAGSMDELLDNPGAMVGFRTAAQMVERGLALVGLSWEALQDRDVVERQIVVWSRLPEWMERQPAGFLWRTRGLVFGRELTRVPRALWAVAQAWVPEGPESYDDFDQDGRWGLARGPDGRVLLMLWRDSPALEPWLEGWTDA